MEINEATTECLINLKGLNARRLRPEDIDTSIKDAQYYVFPNTQLTVCCMTLKNGFTVTGESACASPENFDADLGKKIARQNAVNKIWPLEGYLLKERLSGIKSQLTTPPILGGIGV